MSKHKRWKRKIRRCRWRSLKRAALASGKWREPVMNLLVPIGHPLPQPSIDTCLKLGWTPMGVDPAKLAKARADHRVYLDSTPRAEATPEYTVDIGRYAADSRR